MPIACTSASLTGAAAGSARSAAPGPTPRGRGRLPPGRCLWLATWACGVAAPATGCGAGGSGPNVLLVVADDLGVEAAACYPDMGAQRAPQPTLEALCAQGLVFDRAWSSPVSSPTRASLLTGQDPWQHGIGEPVQPGSPSLADDVEGLPEVLARAPDPPRTALIGKWHLGADPDQPGRVGWQRFAGVLGGRVDDYRHFEAVVDGAAVPVDQYATTWAVDQALEFVRDGRGPWFVQVSFLAPHLPLHLPPLDLHDYDDLTGDAADIEVQPARYHQAMVQAMDTELGRLLDELPRSDQRDTWVIFAGDNGTLSELQQGAWPEHHGKASLYEGGIHVPLVVSGPELDQPGRRSDVLVQLTDLFATIVDLQAADAAALLDDGVERDSHSLRPLLLDATAQGPRSWVLAEQFGQSIDAVNAGRAVRDDRAKLILQQDGVMLLFDLVDDPQEVKNLAHDPDWEEEEDWLLELLGGLPPQPG